MLIGGPRTLKDPRIQNLLWRTQDPGPHNDPDPYEDTGEPGPWNVWGLQNLCCIFLLVLNNFDLILNILNFPNENLNKVKQCWDNSHQATPTRISLARVTSTWIVPTEIVPIWSIYDLENSRLENSRLG